ncbi:MAG: hypothetical protein AABW48_06465 [Nanoarchaeota archaeon]
MALKTTTKTVLAGVASALITAAPASAEAQQQHTYNMPVGYINNVKSEAHLSVLGVNLAINSVVCGIKAGFEGRNIFKDIGQCFAGATIQYTGMELGAQLNEAPGIPAAAYRATEIGTSMIQNTLKGIGPLEEVNVGFGPAYFQINTKTGKVDYSWNILPVGGLIANMALGNQLDFEKTFLYQTPVFSTAGRNKVDYGYAFGNILTYNRSKSNRADEFLSHEFIHLTQYVRLRPVEQFTETDFLKNKLHLRIGEDLVTGILQTPQIICAMLPNYDHSCRRRWWLPLEVEAYALAKKAPEKK